MVLRALFLRPAWRRPLRLLVTALGVAIGVASLVATVSANRAAVAAMRQGVLELSGPRALEVTCPGGLDEAILAALRPLADRAAVAPVVEEVALLPALGDAVRILGIDPLLDPRLPSGTAVGPSLLTVLTERAVLLPEPLARQLGLAAGDTLALSVRSRLEEARVAAVVAPPPPTAAWERTIVMDVAAAQELFGRLGRLDRVEVRPRSERDDLADLARELRRLVPAAATVAEPVARAAGTSRMVRALHFNLTALSGISLLVAGVLVATTLATSVVQRRSLIALLRSLGASPRQLATAVLAEALAMGVVGGTVGVALGILGARAALASVRVTAAAVLPGLPPAAIALDPDVAVAGFLLAVGVAAVAALAPLAEALATPPLQGLRWENPQAAAAGRNRTALAAAAGLLLAAAGLTQAPPVGGLPYAALLASLAVLAAVLLAAGPVVQWLATLANRGPRWWRAPAVRLAGGALLAGRRRAAWAAGAVGITVGLAVAVTIMVHSFRVTVLDWSQQALRADVWIRPLASPTGFGVGRLDPEIVAMAQELFGRDAVDPFHTTRAVVSGREVTLGGGAMEVIARRGGVPFRSGEDSRQVFRRTAARRGAVVNEPFANRTGLGEGDEVTILTPKGEIRRPITGVFFDYSRQEGMVVLDREDYLAHVPDDGPREIGLFLPPDRDPAAAREALLRRLGGRFLVEALLNRELRREVIAIFDRTFAITRALRVVSVVVAVMAVLTVLFALLAERRRDLAVLRAVGASRAQVGALVLVEAALVGLAGAALGLLSGCLVGKVLVEVVNLQSFAWTLRLVVPWPNLAGTVAWLVAACLVAALAPALAASRLVLQEELREEG